MKSPLKILKWTVISLITLAVLAYGVTWIVIYNLSPTTHGSVDLTPGNIRVPRERTMGYVKRPPSENAPLVSKARSDDETLKSGSTYHVDISSQFVMGWNLDLANQRLLEAHPGGQFSTLAYAKLLYNYCDRLDIMYPETQEYIVNVLLFTKGGEDHHYWTPNIYGLPLRDTENIILCYEVSRYLTNQWVKNHGNDDPFYDNTVNGQQEFLLQYLQGIERAGIYEFNSVPYQRYTLDALNMIAAFAESSSLSDSATRILDRVNWNYALGSLSLRRYPPFRRLREKAPERGLYHDPHTVALREWLGIPHGQSLITSLEDCPDQWVIYTEFEPYRPPDDVVKWIFEKPVDYFVQMGHGSDGSPEIYSGGPGYLITAGGVTIEFARRDVARPTTLMLNDGVMCADGLLRVMGTGDDYTKWNNTGVYKKFAVAAGPVIIPDGWEPSLTLQDWLFFERAGQKIAIYTSPKLGIFCLLPEGDLQKNAKLLAEENADLTRRKTTFQLPWGDSLEYDVYADKDQWVIRSINGKAVDRDHGSWPLLQGELPGYQNSNYAP